MPHPKKRKTKAGTNQRRSHHALSALNLTTCRKCGKTILPHKTCPGCGYYKGKEVIDVNKKLSNKEKSKVKKASKKDNKKDKESEAPKEESKNVS